MIDEPEPCWIARFVRGDEVKWVPLETGPDGLTESEKRVFEEDGWEFHSVFDFDGMLDD